MCDLLAPIVSNVTWPLAALCDASAGVHAAECGAVSAVARDAVSLVCGLSNATEEACALASVIVADEGELYQKAYDYCTCVDVGWAHCQVQEGICNEVHAAVQTACAGHERACNATRVVVTKWVESDFPDLAVLSAVASEVSDDVAQGSPSRITRK